MELIKTLHLDELAITLLSLVITYVIIELKKLFTNLKEKQMTKIDNDMLRTMAKTITDFVELKYKDYASEDKLKKAFSLLDSELKKYNINVNDTLKYIVIESMVKALKDNNLENKKEVLDNKGSA